MLSLPAVRLTSGRSPRAGVPSLLMDRDASSKARAREERFRTLVEAESEFVWRSLRRLGVPASDADDATQEVFVVAARRLADFTEERQRAFLFGTALRVASTRRRTRLRRPEHPELELDAEPASGPSPDRLVELRRARVALQEILDAMSVELRSVFVLAELEELSGPAIAELLEIPVGTVSSRLRAARATFRRAVQRLAAQDAFPRRIP